MVVTIKKLIRQNQMRIEELSCELRFDLMICGQFVLNDANQRPQALTAFDPTHNACTHNHGVHIHDIAVSSQLMEQPILIFGKYRRIKAR